MYDRTTLPALHALAAQWLQPSGSRAGVLLNRLIVSAEIYDDYVRAKTDNDPALHYRSATRREAWLKTQFIQDYRAAAATALPRALFKFGDNHIRRGVGSTGAWTLGTFAADLATFNGMECYSVLIVAIGGDVPDWSHRPAPLLPDARPGTAQLIDLSALRPNAESLLAAVPAAVREETRATIYGFDAIVVLPNSTAATWHLTGFAPP